MVLDVYLGQPLEPASQQCDLRGCRALLWREDVGRGHERGRDVARDHHVDAPEPATVVDELRTLATVDLFREGREREAFIGHPFYFDYWRVKILANDKWKHAVGGVPAGASYLACTRS